MTETNKYEKYVSDFYGEVEVIYTSVHDEVVVRFDDLSVAIFENATFRENFTRVNSTDGWLTVVKDSEYGEPMFLDMVHVTKENAEQWFYNEAYDEEYILIGFKYVSWNSLDQN